MQAIRLDPAFALYEGPGLRLHGPVHGRDAARLLAQRVHREPGDLRAHVLRIQLLIAAGSRRKLAGALVDLHIALAGGGDALRKRMMAAARPQLDHAQRALFDGFIDTPPTPRTVLDGIRGSVLSKGYEGSGELISQKTAQVGFSSVLEEAMSCIEYGQVDEARVMLENALLESPDDEALCKELINLYGYLDDELLIVDFCSRFVEEGEDPPEAIADLLGLE